MNKLKVILNMDEDLVYKYFPNRENNFYAKSIKRIIPSNIFAIKAAVLFISNTIIIDYQDNKNTIYIECR